MTVTLQTTSTFGRYALRQICESTGSTRLVVVLLNVGTTVPGDRTTWTWESNWKAYASSTAFSGSGGSLNLLSVGSPPPSTIDLFEPANTPFVGARYGGDYEDDDRYIYLYYTGASNISYTHAAIFVRQPIITSINDLQNPNTNLCAVIARNTAENAGTLSPNSYVFIPFAPVEISLGGDPPEIFVLNRGATVTCSSSFSDWADISQIYDQAYNSETPYADPYPLISYEKAYPLNIATSPFFLDAFKRLLGVDPDVDNSISIFAELLNVTGAEPDFDEGWSGWETYRIKVYSVTNTTPTYKYETLTETYEGELDEIQYLYTTTGVQVSTSEPIELLIQPPASGSFTFTHIAVFLNEADAPPPSGSTHVYTNSDSLAGIITLPSSVTMTTTSNVRAYPIDFAFMYQPEGIFELL